MPDPGEILFKIKGCGYYYMLHELEEDFNKIGLTIQTTLRDNKILCKIVEGKPYAEKPLRDYVFVGSLTDQTDPIPDRILDTICEFVVNNAGLPAVMDTPRVWRQGSWMYGRITVVNEDVHSLGHSVLAEADPPKRKKKPINEVIRSFAKDTSEDIDCFDDNHTSDFESVIDQVDEELI